MSFEYQLKWTDTGDAISPAPKYSICDANGQYGLRRDNEGISLHDTYEAAVGAAQTDFDRYTGRVTGVQPMETAPKDGTWIKLLIDYSVAGLDACPLEDSAEPGWTLGSNNFENTEVDEWSWMGWDWNHDCIRETRAGKPIGWAPFHERSENGNKLPVSGKVFPADLIAKLDALCSPAAEAMSDSERLTQLVRTGQEVVKELSR